MRSRSTILFSILITLTVGLFLLDLAVGAVNIPIRDVWAALTGGNCSRATEKIVLNIRLIKSYSGTVGRGCLIGQRSSDADPLP